MVTAFQRKKTETTVDAEEADMTRREDIENELAQLESELEEAQSEVSYFEEELEGARSKVDELETQLDDLEEELEMLDDNGVDSGDPAQLEILEAE